jgi:hypothetical protein
MEQKPSATKGAILDPSAHNADTKREAERKRFQARIAKWAKGYDKLSRELEQLFGQPLPPPPSPEAVQVMQRMKRPKLTPKQSRLIENLAGGATITDAAIEAGYSASSRMTAGQLGSQALESVRRKMPEVLAAHGLTDDTLVQKLGSLLNAKETKFFQKDGKITDSVALEALGIQAQALDMAFNVRGAYPQRGGDGVNVGTVNILWHGQAPAWIPQPQEINRPMPSPPSADEPITVPSSSSDAPAKLAERVDRDNGE